MGPLRGYRIIELAGLGPGPMGAMMLGDMGADVIRIDRMTSAQPDRFTDPRYDVHGRSRRSIAIDIRTAQGRDCALRLIATADGLIDPFRPGVTERLGLGPGECQAINPRLNYLRITGWGQTGPLAGAAGHDINYIALTGLLQTIGTPEGKPIPPLNLVGDFGGGGMLVALGMTSALLETARSGKGQVIDAAMMEGAALLFGGAFGMYGAGLWRERGKNQVDGGAPYYQVYETSDGKHVSVGAIEPQFYALLLDKLGLNGSDLSGQYDYENWPELIDRLSAIFRTKTRDDWCALLEGTDACFAPVLTPGEAAAHHQAAARQSYWNADGVPQPAPAPRYSRTPSEAKVAPKRGEHTSEVLLGAGFSAAELSSLRAVGAIA